MKRAGKLAVLVAVALTLGLTGAANAATVIKVLNHTDEVTMMGQVQPASDDTTVYWFDDKNGFVDTGREGVALYRADERKVYLIDNKAKTYAVVSLDPDAEQAANPMAAMMGKPTVTVTPTEETKKIGDWTVTKYLVTMEMGPMKMSQTNWATEDVDIDIERYQTLQSGMMLQIPGFTEAVKEMFKVKGIIVEGKGTVNVMGTEVKTSSRLLEAAEKDAPAGIFELPEGYTKVDMLQPGR